MDGFRIRWKVRPSVWRSTREAARRNPPGSFYDRHFGMIYGSGPSSLDGPVQLRSRDAVLYPEDRPSGAEGRTRRADGVSRSIVQLAVQLAGMMAEPHPLPTGRVVHLGDWGSGSGIALRRVDDTVEILADGGDSERLSTSIDDFFAGVSAFVDAFGRAMFRYAPEALAWEALRPLARSVSASMTAAEAAPGALGLSWRPNDINWAAIREARAANPPGSFYDDLQLPLAALFGAPIAWVWRGERLAAATPSVALDSAWRSTHGMRPGAESEADGLWPLLDMAVQIARTLAASPSGGPRRRVLFQLGTPRHAVVNASFLVGIAALVGRPAFETASRRFLHEFIRAVCENAPRAVEWDAFAAIRRYGFP